MYSICSSSGQRKTGQGRSNQSRWPLLHAWEREQRQGRADDNDDDEDNADDTNDKNDDDDHEAKNDDDDAKGVNDQRSTTTRTIERQRQDKLVSSKQFRSEAAEICKVSLRQKPHHA